MARSSFKERVANGEIVFGGYVFSSNPISVEIIGHTGFDFVFIDTEHAMIGSDTNLENLIRAAEVCGLYPVVRVKENQEHFIRNALEAGAKGLCIPHVATKEDAQNAVRYSRFAPKGCRGVNPLARSAKWGHDFELNKFLKQSNEEIIVIPLLEDKEFVENLDEILSVDGIDSVAFGPFDYCISIGVNDISHPMVKQAQDMVFEKAKEKGIPLHAAVVPPTLERANELIEKGANFLAIGADIEGISSLFKSIMANVVQKISKKSLK